MFHVRHVFFVFFLRFNTNAAHLQSNTHVHESESASRPQKPTTFTPTDAVLSDTDAREKAENGKRQV